MANVSNTDDVIDSRDVIERIEELEDERQSLADEVSDAQETLNDAEDDTSVLDAKEIRELKDKFTEASQARSDWDEENGEELTALKNLADEGANESSDWAYGETLIHENYFTEYAQQLVEDIGDLPRGFPHYIVLDWEQTAENIKVDYSTVDFDGETYYIRNS